MKKILTLEKENTHKQIHKNRYTNRYMYTYKAGNPGTKARMTINVNLE